VCSFEGFQFGTRRAISAPEPEDPDREVAQPLRGIGGLHHEAKHETMFDRIEVELKGVQQALYSSCAVPTTPLSAGDIEVGDEPTQLPRCWRRRSLLDC
jgi:hypothetical protein